MCCVLRLSRQPTHLDIQILPWPEVHDVYVEIIICSLGQQLAKHKHLRGYVHGGLLAGATYMHLWLAPLEMKMNCTAFGQPIGMTTEKGFVLLSAHVKMMTDMLGHWLIDQYDTV